MRYILLGNLWKRVGARLIDFILSIGLTCAIFFGAVYPATFNQAKYTENLERMGEIYQNSGLYIVSSKGNYTSIGAFTSINTLEELTSITLYSDGEEFKDVNLTKQLYDFYTTKFVDYGGDHNFTLDTFKSMILKVGSQESNIKDFTFDNNVFTYTLIDSEQEYETVTFVKDAFLNAANIVISTEEVTKLSAENENLMYSSLYYLIPIFIGFSLIFELLIPLFSPEGKSIGKFIFKLGILTKDGYELSKYKLVIRWLAYLVLEIALGILTVGGTILISYTMLMFNKKKRVLHDYVAGTMVVDTKTLFYFKNAEEERRFQERMGSKSI